MPNNFPCARCGQAEYKLYHTLEKEVKYYDELENNYLRLGQFESAQRTYYHKIKLIDDASKRGWDGHPYKPVDNLVYLEMKEAERNG